MDLRSEKPEVKKPHPVWNTVVNTIDYPFDKMADVLVALDADPSGITVSKIPLSLASIGVHQFHPIAGVVAFVIASIPDILDGKVARKTGKVSIEGAVLDALTDKVVNAYMYFYIITQLSWKNIPQDQHLILLMAFNFSLDIVSQKMRGGLWKQVKTSAKIVWDPKQATPGKSSQEATIAGKIKAHLQCYGIIAALLGSKDPGFTTLATAFFAMAIPLSVKSIKDRW